MNSFFLFSFVLIFNFTNGQDFDDSVRKLITEKCIKDIDTWKKSLRKLSAELLQCGKLEACQDFKKQTLHDNIYSLYQLDSFAKLPPNLLGFNKVWSGDYDECLEVENPNDNTYQTQFCWAHLNLPIGKILAKSGDAVKTVSTTCGAGKPTDVKMSICMPRSCSEHDLKFALNHLRILPMTTKEYLNHSIVPVDDDKFVCDVTCRPVNFEPDYLFWIVTVILGTITFICVVATIADYYQEVENEKMEMSLGEKTIKERGVSEEGIFKYFLAFSMLSNGRSLMRISKNLNNLKGVECIRFISFTWVVSGHIWGTWMNADNPFKIIDILNTRSYEIWLNAFFSVDTFFFLSGLMLSYSFLPKLSKRKAMDPMVWAVFYLHRILRLTPAYLSFIIFYATYGPLTDFGPNELVRREDMENCKKYGWKNLLYINNIYEPRKNCLSISWYMASDTQMYLFSPLLLVAFLFGPIPGILFSITVIVLSTFLNYWLFLHYDLPLTLIQAYMTGDEKIIHILQDFVYEAAYIRIPPFIFGIVMGYVMLKTRDIKIHMNTSVVFACWLVSFILSLGSIFTIHSYNRGDYWTPMQRASYYGFSRIAWSISLSWLIFAINRGQSGLIGKFMSLSFWTPLGKLTFCAYLCHIMIVNAIFNLERSPPHFVGAFHTVS
ncbi:hypothetical protein GCK72_014424 [Caenorhabditis remanei]|uniref:Nose resistant-to-fluoxetine protein N-terminal domain-containing protein n=1 Tax=Caenorhabditis remanei TaxID=31234 RepID=A0A6A5GTP1_CAERE|nr:hypothetical protein GCK72_014424 [Caenorhabditis remanei]KAF1757966.1 hypothetical protein GCK72_014424 [Caenorhabditis remanei]